MARATRVAGRRRAITAHMQLRPRGEAMASFVSTSRLVDVSRSGNASVPRAHADGKANDLQDESNDRARSRSRPRPRARPSQRPMRRGPASTQTQFGQAPRESLVARLRASASSPSSARLRELNELGLLYSFMRGRRSGPSEQGRAPNEAPRPQQQIPVHPSVPTCRPGELVTTRAQLEAMVDEVMTSGSGVGIDTEFVSELSFRAELCLVQVATTKKIWIVDALSPEIHRHIDHFWRTLVIDKAHEKIVHAGDQDLEHAFRSTGRIPENIFDTQLTAAFADNLLEAKYPASLARLADELVGTDLSNEIGKGTPSMTVSDWVQRPLRVSQLEYAANDVRFLPLMREKLGELVEKTGNAAWLQDEHDRVYRLNANALYVPRPTAPHALRNTGVDLKRMDAEQGAVLKALCDWRFAQAREWNVPQNAVLSTRTMIDLAVGANVSISSVKGLNNRIRTECGAEIMAVVHQARERVHSAGEGDSAETSGTLRSAQEMLNSRDINLECQPLKLKLEKRCAEQNIASRLAFSLNDLREVLDGRKAHSKLFTGWRSDLFSDLLLEF
ncbi:Ribonuclease D [Porphyridium purpureum]|uniref:Ribonuclease D n=1 Tax=Porphyridium purpureum TaxID=35688 RepID=A0A5J4YKK0_PORPP|nr:Ribonuclease D [Porphyridium purpureum]|eukprot:POR0111..scf246_12